MEQLSEKEGNTNKNLLNYLLKCLPAYFISCISLYQCLPQSPSVIFPPTASHEQGPEHTTRPLRDDRQHILATVHRDAAPLWYCSEAPREQLQDPPGNLLLMQWSLKHHLSASVFNVSLLG